MSRRRQAGPQRRIKPPEIRAPGRSAAILLRGAGITLIAVLIYWNSLSAPFTFDDGPSVIDNTQIRRLWPLSEALSPPSSGQPVAGRPLVNLSFAINLEAHEALADALFAQRKFDETRLRYSEVLKSRPDKADTLSHLGTTLAATGRPDEALQTLRRAVELDPDNAWVHGTLADFLLNQRDFEGAVQQAEQAVRLAPRDPAVHRLLGLALIAQLRWDEAIAQFQASLAIDPTNAETRTYLTRALKLKDSPVP